MLKVGIIVGTTRPGRLGTQVAEWVHGIASKRTDASFEIVDIADYDLPVLDEPVPASMRNYSKDHTKRWSEKIDSLDAYVFVTPEYNHSITGAMKNALDFVYQEWNDKAAGFVSYGSAGGTRAVEHLRGIMAELQVADVRGHVSLSLFTDFENFSTFKPNPAVEPHVDGMLNQVVAWGGAMKRLRADRQREAA